MDKAMTPSQINKAVSLYRALLEKHAGEFNSKAVQTVLGQQELAGEQFAVFRQRVEVVSSSIVRRVKVSRARTPQEVLDATNRKQYTDRAVVNRMPKGEGDEVEVVFFKLEGNTSDDGLEKEYERRGLKPADPYSVAAVSEADQAFADEKPNATHWKNADGKWCFAAFARWYDWRHVSVGRSDYDWRDLWWFAGLRK